MTKSTIIVAVSALAFGIVIGHFATRRGSEDLKDVDLAQSRDVISPTREFAQGLEVTVIDFEDTTLEEAVDFLRGLSRTGVEIAGQPRPFRLNFIVLDPEETARPINLRLKAMKLDRLCERIAEASGVSVTFDQDAIVFTTENKTVEQGARGNGR